MIPTAPLRVRNHLAEIILTALEKPEARRALVVLGEADAAPPDWLSPDLDCRPLVRQRALSAAAALAELPARHRDSRADILNAAAALFDAHLYFEVHELLEPVWRDAGGGEREALQGLIQIAVGYQHLANGNLAGARALLDEGRRRLDGRTLEGLDLDAFGQKVARTSDRIQKLDWRTVPPFPRPQSGPRAGGAAGKAVNPRKELS
ncbi:MAG TPA: DUF309 domain-containing protein [Methylomirabilota bacterium]|nr:DUF309 domain-containing protein [Methylomirabilota bacterium]